MPDEAEYQPRNSIFQTMLLPDSTSSMTLSGGRNIPHTFYLGPNNTVPFVRLENPAASMQISWGELITVQPGQQVVVRNTSCMPGDLEIQSGTVPAPHPPRITTTVKCTVTASSPTSWPNGDIRRGTTLKIQPQFPCDTRTARRAWLALRPGVPVLINAEDLGNYNYLLNDVAVRAVADVENLFHMHSRVMQNDPTEFSFRHTISNTDRDAFQLIPLGIYDGGNAMRLADTARVSVYLELISPVAIPGDFVAFENELVIEQTAAYLLEY